MNDCATAMTPEQSKKWQQTLRKQMLKRIQSGKTKRSSELMNTVSRRISAEFRRKSGMLVPPFLLRKDEVAILKHSKAFGSIGQSIIKATVRLSELVRREYNTDFERIKSGQPSLYLR